VLFGRSGNLVCLANEGVFLTETSAQVGMVNLLQMLVKSRAVLRQLIPEKDSLPLINNQNMSNIDCNPGLKIHIIIHL